MSAIISYFFDLVLLSLLRFFIRVTSVNSLLLARTSGVINLRRNIELGLLMNVVSDEQSVSSSTFHCHLFIHMF